jgi:hypothetical protein
VLDLAGRATTIAFPAFFFGASMELKDLKPGAIFWNQDKTHYGILHSWVGDSAKYTWHCLAGDSRPIACFVQLEDVKKYLRFWSPVSPLMKELL